MRSFLCRTASAVVLAALLPTVLTSTPAVAEASGGVRLLGETIVPHKLAYAGTTVGGLSGIDRDPCSGEYVLISDDRSYLQPARFYTAKIRVDVAGVHGVDFTGTHAFQQPDGSAYPIPTLNDGKAVDPEEIRVDPWTCEYRWAQEGNRPKSATAPDPVIQPSIQTASRTGVYRGQLPLPANYAITMAEQGPRRNQSLEAITFGAFGGVITSAVEGPLIQDGPVPTTERGALIRVTQQNRRGTVLGQYAYPLEPIFAEPTPGSPWEPDTGVPAILAYPEDPSRYLILERTYVDGSGFKVRLFDTTTRGAADVRGVQSLATTQTQPMRKRLVADFDDIGLSTVDNVEGMTWGPRLPTGERTLVLVSDDNFHPLEVTQVFALALR
ncbi:hypothetical protein [Alloactinosynnema sp. L-07]|uniref:esterase-like activity of phytase family protein n=1 Tax=Alloactinosynnema sp. L-07 TaxID=1653480 RepID=UPI00065EF865|nr:esterase-like activity of phytase family protein [Alloactinosynnema sp. L-07]CRK61782.1 hypothetical protein [Alloactinosynnema sp. L-07]